MQKFNITILNVWIFIGPQAVGNVVLTGGGNLNCKHIAHIAGPSKITASIPPALQLCESKQAATVSFPIIGTGKIICLC